MKKIIKFSSIIFFLISCNFCYSQVQLLETNGEKIFCKISNEDNSSIYYSYLRQELKSIPLLIKQTLL